MSRPALRITRNDSPEGSPSFVFEVWDPYTVGYRPHPSLDAAIADVDSLVGRIRQSWVDKTVLKDLVEVPDPDLDDEREWAEFRVSAQANRVHETRNWDARHWRKAMAGRAGAVETTCNEVGYRPVSSGVSQE